MAQSSIWQQIFDAVKFRFQEIRINNGYETEIGAHAFSWRDLDASPMHENELPGFSLRDLSRSYEPEAQTINRHHFLLRFEVKAESVAVVSSPVDKHARRMISDLDKSLGVDRQWEIGGVKLAKDTLPDTDTIETVHRGELIVRVTKTFGIRYQNLFFNPYQQ